MSSTLVLTDRSRYEAGTGFCPRFRELKYHSGPTGAGIRRASEAIPLARGTYVHAGIAGILQHIQRTGDTPVPDLVIRTEACTAALHYREKVSKSGLALLDQSDTAVTLIAEQSALVEALIWVWAIEFLPWLLEHYEVVKVEEERVHVLGCTCGLGDGVFGQAEHEARGCQGIGWMSRLDTIVRKRTTGRLAYFEWKTVGQTGERWDTQWELQPQFAAGAAVLEAGLGEPVDELWVGGLICGNRRQSEWDPSIRKASGPKIQDTVLLYPWYNPGNPPLQAPDWAAQYNFVGPDGKNHRLTKGYTKTPVWTATFEGQAEGQSAVEYWVKWLPPAVRQAQLAIIGPLNPQQHIVAEMFDEVVHHEREWQRKLWEAYQVLERCGFDATNLDYRAVRNRLFPRSWACRRYGKAHQCEFVPLCHEQEGHQTPLEHGFVLRRPHHPPETEQLQARGVEVPEDWAEEESDDQQ